MLYRLFGSPQLVVRGRRVHHGLVGCWLICVGVALIVDDLPDRRVWRSDFPRQPNPEVDVHLRLLGGAYMSRPKRHDLVGHDWLPEGKHRTLHITHVTPAGAPVPFTGGGAKLVWHTTESSPGSVAVVDQVLRAKHAEPHFVIGRGTTGLEVIQYFPLSVGGRALEHPSGTPETNAANCVQIEVCGYAQDSHSWDGETLDALATLARMIERRTKIPRRRPRRFRSLKDGAGQHRFSGWRFVLARGHVGHQHAASQPGGHWDPGALRIREVFRRMDALGW
jgi:hypothetical protein